MCGCGAIRLRGPSCETPREDHPHVVHVFLLLRQFGLTKHTICVPTRVLRVTHSVPCQALTLRHMRQLLCRLLEHASTIVDITVPLINLKHHCRHSRTPLPRVSLEVAQISRFKGPHVAHVFLLLSASLTTLAFTSAQPTTAQLNIHNSTQPHQMCPSIIHFDFHNPLDFYTSFHVLMSAHAVLPKILSCLSEKEPSSLFW